MSPGCDWTKQNTLIHSTSSPPQQQNVRRQGSLAFSLFGVLLAHGDLRNNKLSQLAVNLWNLSHKHGYCETRVSVSFSLTHLQLSCPSLTQPSLLSSAVQVRTLESIKQQAQQPDMTHLTDTVQRLTLQSRT